MIDIKALEKALATLGSIGKGELTIDAGGTPVTLRVLTADEDQAAQKYSRMTEEGEEEPSGLTFLERYKRSLLAYAIIQIGDLDLRNEDYILTGEVTDTGVPVRAPRHVVVRGIIDGWARVTTMALFQKYLELQRREDAAAERAIQFDVTDIDEEITRVEKRLADLKDERKRSILITTAGSPASAAARAPEPEPPAPVVPAVEAPPPEPPPAPAPRQRVGPVQGAPPMPPMRPVEAPPTPMAAANPSTFEEMHDSMGDGPEQIANETARLLAARQAARRQSLDTMAEEPPTIEAQVRRTPPHRAAANTSDAVMDSDAGSFKAVRATGGPPPNVDVHRLEPVTLSERGRQPPPANTRVQVNNGPKTGPTNPRFRGQ